MAKQRGIHQISGKINNLCYYEQKYVRGGLIRRINEAMSERLKTDPVFANTRHANTIFGGCSKISSVLLSFFGKRNTYLFKPYRHALLTRAIQDKTLFYDNSLEYPVIFSKQQSTIQLPNIIERIVKNSIFDSFPELERTFFGLSLSERKDFTFSHDSLVSFCEKYKCKGVQLSLSRAHYLYNSSYQDDASGYNSPDNNAGGRVSFTNWYLNDSEGDVVLSTDTGTVDDAVTFWIIYATPILSTFYGRPVLGGTGESCGVLTFFAE